MSTGRPLVTFALFTYNQEEYVAAAVQAALDQSHMPMEIIISDDCSSDATYEQIVRAVDGYRGPHALRLNRNKRRLGIGGHVNRMMEMAHGQLIVAAAGDDVSLPHRTARIFERWQASRGNAHLFGSDVIEVPLDGPPIKRATSYLSTDFDPEWIALTGCGVLGATAAWTRWLWERFGPLPESTVHEDVVMTLWGAVSGGVAVDREPLVRYRIGSSRWLTDGNAPPLGRGTPMGGRDLPLKRRELQVALAQSQLRSIIACEHPRVASALERRLRAMQALLCIHQGLLPEPEACVRLALDRHWGPKVARTAMRRWIPGATPVLEWIRCGAGTTGGTGQRRKAGRPHREG
jgi:glycosyltransferase involved in cell wall biosynthesis